LSKQALDLLATGMLRVPQNPSEKASICELAMPVTMAMRKFPPAQQAQLQAAVDNCKATDAPTRRNVAAAESYADNRPASELLAQAADTSDARSRAHLKLTAAQEAESAGEYQRALDILAGLTPEERDAQPIWSSRWRMIAMKATRNSYKAHDLQTIQNVLAEAPGDLRASLMVDISFLAYAAKDEGYGLTMLTQARRELEKNPVTDNYMPYLSLLNAYAARLPEEGAQVLRLAVDGINNFKVPEGAKMRPVDFGWQLRPVHLPAALLDSDPQMVSAAVSELKTPQARIAMRLGLLQACLQRYQAPPRRTPPKAEPALKATTPEKKN
jgi:hypothetical protein